MITIENIIRQRRILDEGCIPLEERVFKCNFEELDCSEEVLRAIKHGRIVTYFGFRFENHPIEGYQMIEHLPAPRKTGNVVIWSGELDGWL